jgi:hypothetical protein
MCPWLTLCSLKESEGRENSRLRFRQAVLPDLERQLNKAEIKPLLFRGQSHLKIGETIKGKQPQNSRKENVGLNKSDEILMLWDMRS